jgi:hypothetical protein
VLSRVGERGPNCGPRRACSRSPGRRQLGFRACSRLLMPAWRGYQVPGIDCPLPTRKSERPFGVSIRDRSPTPPISCTNKRRHIRCSGRMRTRSKSQVPTRVPPHENDTSRRDF